MLEAFIRKPAPLLSAVALIAMMFSLSVACRYESSAFPREATAAHNATTRNPAYRLQVYGKEGPKLPATQDWSLEYQFIVPPLPSTPTWNYKTATVYQWGDVDFDSYGSRGTYRLSDYRFNQVVPQLILGNVLDRDANYRPSWSQRNTWAIQAQYYWYRDTTATSYAQTGNVVTVSPGDEITTSISYRAGPGTLLARIEDGKIPGGAGLSTITIRRPFPNDPALFTDWRDFFKRATAASKTSYVLSTPAVDVETDYLDEPTMCGLLPLTLRRISIPGTRLTPSAFSIQQLGGFTCPQPSVKFDF